MPSKLSMDPKTVCNSSYNYENGSNPRVFMTARNALETFAVPKTVCNSSYNCENGPNPRVLVNDINALETVEGGQNNMQ